MIRTLIDTALTIGAGLFIGAWGFEPWLRELLFGEDDRLSA